jgi:hypothetical protein
MEYITIAAIIALVLPTAHAIWTAYDADMDEWEEDEKDDA